jgi:hypothetical protein
MAFPSPLADVQLTSMFSPISHRTIDFPLIGCTLYTVAILTAVSKALRYLCIKLLS